MIAILFFKKDKIYLILCYDLDPCLMKKNNNLTNNPKNNLTNNPKNKNPSIKFIKRLHIILRYKKNKKNTL